GAGLDQAELAHLREGAGAAAPPGVAEGGRVGRGVGDVVDGAVEADQPPALVEGARRVGPGQGAGQPPEEQAEGGRSQALARLAEAGAVGVPVTGEEAAGGLE